jgi:hypothetical protein
MNGADDISAIEKHIDQRVGLALLNYPEQIDADRLDCPLILRRSRTFRWVHDKLLATASRSA